MPTEKQTPVILFRTDSSPGLFGTEGDCLRFELTVHYLNEDNLLRNYSTGLHSEPYADLSIRAQLTRELDAREPYGWAVEYREPFSVDLERAELMVKTLRRVNRKLEKFRADLGPADTFVAYVARVALALGVKTFMWPVSESPRGMYSDNEYGHGDAEVLGWRIREAITKFLDPAPAN